MFNEEEKDIFDFLGIVYIEPENRQSGAVLQKKWNYQSWTKYE